MKILLLTILMIFTLSSVYAQNVSDYFPVQTGYKWYFESVPLDSLNNPINSLKYYGIDSFAVVTPYSGRTANVVLTKSGSESTINYIPFLDSLYYSFDGTNGFEYFDPKSISGLLGNVDTTLGINFINFFDSLEGWYSYYRFASPSNVEYQVFKKDTAVIVNSISATLRFELIGKRIADETINTAIGTFTCKKFVMEVRISYLFLNIFPIKMFGVEDTLWFAPDSWKVKSYIPATNVDLSYLGLSAFNVPGLETNITTPITSIEDNNEIVNNFELYQNYPNPFNPSTIIYYSIPNVISTEGRNLNILLKVYDVLGNEVATLVNEYKQAGNYEVKFEASKLSSGIYLYQLNVNNVIHSRKMVLLK